MNLLIHAEQTPLIACVFNDRDVIDVNKDLISQADLIELRIDMFEDITIEHVKNIVKIAKDKFNKPLIITVRDIREGGQKAISDRFPLYEAAMPLSDFIDVEVNSEQLLQKVRDTMKEGLLIGSYHNFDLTPKDEFLDEIVFKGRDLGADIIKIAVTSKNRSDLIRLLLFTLKHKEKRIITMGMGEHGLPSRIIAPLFGSLITYGYVTKPSAPGQLSISQLSETLNLLNIR